jgi:hypothetical protein
MDEKQIVNPHANFFQKVFSRHDVARDFICNYLPEKLVKQLDLNTLELDRESFVDILLSATQSDLVFKVKRKDGKKLLIYILFEHKSFVDRWVLFQLLGYSVRISEREREIQSVERKKKRQANLEQDLPENTGIEKECITVVLPVIMYHGQKDWNVDENLSAVYCSADSFVNYVPEFDFELIDLSSFKDHQITGNVYLRVAMLVMKHYNSDQFDEIFSTMLSLLAEHLNEVTTIHFIATVTLYSSSHQLRGKKWLTSNIENNYIKAFGEKGGNVMNTVGNIWIEQGIKEGLIKKAREMVLEATKIKYNNASQPLTSILQSIKDEEMLNNLHREVFLCNNISEFQHKLEKIRAAEA